MLDKNREIGLDIQCGCRVRESSQRAFDITCTKCCARNNWTCNCDGCPVEQKYNWNQTHLPTYEEYLRLISK